MPKLIKISHFRPEYLLIIQALFFGMIICLLLGYTYLRMDIQLCLMTISIINIICFIYAVIAWGIVTGSLFDPYILFLAAAMLFTGGYSLIIVFGIKPINIFDAFIKFSPPTVLSALFLAGLGLLSFQTGGMLAALIRKGRKQIALPDKIDVSSKQQTALWIIGLLLLFISFLPQINMIRTTLSAVIAGGYSAFFKVDSGTGIAGTQRILSIYFIPGVLFFLSGSKKRPLSQVFSLILIFTYAAVQFSIGSRMLAAMPLLAFGWVWHKAVHRLPAVFLLVSGSILLFVIFPVVGAIRMTAGNLKILTPALIFQSFTSIQNPFIYIISEMASTIYTVAWTLELVPKIRPFAMGSSYYYALYSLIPNLFWNIHPSSANELSRWISQTVTPDFAAAGGGWGYSFAAEAYLNFGWFGMPFALACLGFIYAWFVLWASKSTDHAKIALLASFSSFFYLFARGESASLPRNFVWYSYIPFLLVIILSRIKLPYFRKKQRTSDPEDYYEISAGSNSLTQIDQ